MFKYVQHTTKYFMMKVIISGVKQTLTVLNCNVIIHMWVKVAIMTYSQDKLEDILHKQLIVVATG